MLVSCDSSVTNDHRRTRRRPTVERAIDTRSGWPRDVVAGRDKAASSQLVAGSVDLIYYLRT
jgi:hypothetical protein